MITEPVSREGEDIAPTYDRHGVLHDVAASGKLNGLLTPNTIHDDGQLVLSFTMPKLNYWTADSGISVSLGQLLKNNNVMSPELSFSRLFLEHIYLFYQLADGSIIAVTTLQTP